MRNRILSYTVLSVNCLISSQLTLADDYFNPNLVEGNSHFVDLSVFNKTGGQEAGSYSSEIYINSNHVDERDVNYEHLDSKLVPLLTKQDYINFGVNTNATPEFMALPDDHIIKDIGAVIPDALTNFNFEQRKLKISIPQLYMTNTAQGYISPKEWDDGISALFLDYNTSFASTKEDESSGMNTNAYVNLRSGVNVGAWRLRNYSTYTQGNGTHNWNNINTYAQRDIKSLKSQLIIGDSYTPSDMFDSFAFRGVQLYSDDSMQPSSLRGFAPIIRGIAQTNAQVTISQNGNVIWQSYVPPGPFAIDDLYPTSASGNLEVTIKEADGRVRQFTQPFSSVPIMLREGRFKYSLTAGEYRSTSDNIKEPGFIQTTGVYGLPYDSTVYGGTILASNYKSALLGVGKGLGFLGSVSLDTTVASSKIKGTTYNGLSTRFQYAKDITQTGTTFTLAGYRYSTSDYRDFDEANGYYDYANDTFSDPATKVNNLIYRQSKRNRLQLNVNQSLGDYGSFYASAYKQDYWNSHNNDKNINLGYNKSYKGVNYTFNYSYSQSLYQRQKEQLFSVNIQIPLDLLGRTSWLNLSSTSDDDGKNTTSVGISGTALADNNLSYNAQQSVTKYQGGSGSSSLNYKSSFGEYQLGFNYTRHSQQLNYGARGGAVVHPDGINFTQPLGDTMVLVKAQDAADLKVANNTGIYTNKNGYAVIPYAVPYQRNRIHLNTSNLGDDIDILTDTKVVVPTRGALVVADFPTRVGRKILITLEGMKIPFGAEASIINDGIKTTGIVDNKQQVYLSGVPMQGNILVNWQDGQCKAPFQLSQSDKEIILISLPCH